MLDQETGEFLERQLEHESAKPAGTRAGSSLLGELGHKLWFCALGWRQRGWHGQKA